MVVLEIIRKWFSDHSTIGELLKNDIFECYTLEDCVREVKIKGQTAIPYGEYEVIIDWSNRFKRFMPHVLDVPGFEGIRIHPGNTDKDTEGCILVGKEKKENMIINSREVFIDLYFDILFATQKNEHIKLIIREEREAA